MPEPIDFPGSEKRPQAQFHQAFFYIQRIHLCLVNCNFYSGNNPTAWKRELNVLFRELFPKMTNTEKKELKTLLNNINTTDTLLPVRGASGQYKQDSSKINTLLVDMFDLETKLRVVIDRAGLLMPSKIDVRDTM